MWEPLITNSRARSQWQPAGKRKVRKVWRGESVGATHYQLASPESMAACGETEGEEGVEGGKCGSHSLPTREPQVNGCLRGGASSVKRVAVAADYLSGTSKQASTPMLPLSYPPQTPTLCTRPHNCAPACSHL